MKEHTKIVVVLDRSGSMQSVRDDTIGGFNRFVADQKTAPGSADISLYQFDNEYSPIYENRPLAEAPNLTRETYVPRGSTALLDAIGRTVNTVGATLANMAEADRPNKVVVAIMTDGYENSSREFGADTVKNLIKQQEDVYSWEFIFLGATLDAVNVAQSYGIKAGSAASYNSAKTGETFDTFSESIKSYRSATPTMLADIKAGRAEVFTADARKKMS